ncbi:16S rRNA processing protein RimM [Legionella pneumophila subsp. pneumophila LPE509]|nr:16S rRNA processing protein RimM [Legionella pneumophila subsp. pneumophila LPE509]
MTIEVRSKAIIAQIEGYPKRELVSALTNLDIGVQESQLAALAPGEYYWYQLIGMSVINSKGDLFGKVVEIMPTGSNDVLVVEGEKRHLIPYLPGQFVINVDESQQVITVDWDMNF